MDFPIMTKESKKCHLCGELFDTTSSDPDLKLSREHVPPRQFYPKGIRKKENLNLETAPSHRECNESYREDEEYFYHALYPLVKDNNPNMGNVIFQDFKRRSTKPQTPAMLRNISKTASKITDGGIHLPAGKVQFSLDEYRLQRVVIKIARGVLSLNGIPFIKSSSCIDIRLCQSELEVPELYQLSWQASETPCGDYHKVFSYKYFYFEGHHYVTLLFWESVMYCLCFNDSFAL